MSDDEAMLRVVAYGDSSFTMFADQARRLVARGLLTLIKDSGHSVRVTITQEQKVVATLLGMRLCERT